MAGYHNYSFPDAHNILCIGGAVSIDRDYRKKHDTKHPAPGTASYWADEMPIFDEAILLYILLHCFALLRGSIDVHRMNSTIVGFLYFVKMFR